MLGLNLGRYGMVSGVNLCEAVAPLSADPLLTFLAAPSRTALESGLFVRRSSQSFFLISLTVSISSSSYQPMQNSTTDETFKMW